MAVRDHPSVRSPGRPPGPACSIGTFFCPECGHRSRFDGDWVIVETDSQTEYLCPDCGTDIMTRPPPADESDST